MQTLTPYHSVGGSFTRNLQRVAREVAGDGFFIVNIKTLEM